MTGTTLQLHNISFLRANKVTTIAILYLIISTISACMFVEHMQLTNTICV